MPPGVRDAVVVHLFESAAIGRLNAAVAEQLGEIYRDIVAPVQFSEAIYAADPRFQTWDRIKNLLSRLDPNEPRARRGTNARDNIRIVCRQCNEVRALAGQCITALACARAIARKNDPKTIIKKWRLDRYGNVANDNIAVRAARVVGGIKKENEYVKCFEEV